MKFTISLNYIITKFILILVLSQNLKKKSVFALVLPIINSSSTKIIPEINKKHLSFYELYPNLASLQQLLSSTIDQDSSADSENIDLSLKKNFNSFTTTSINSEELYSKDKSVINIKLIKKQPKKINIFKERRKLSYLKDPYLNFDSPYLIENWDNCTVKFKSFVKSKETGELIIHNNYDLQKKKSSKQIHVKIEGENCLNLPIKNLIPFAKNITTLVIQNTNVKNLRKYSFGVGELIKLEKLYLIDNLSLIKLQSRTFDGLSFLNYLSIINNENLIDIDVDAFAGIKNLEELIFIGNNVNNWSYNFISNFFKKVSSKILPSLIHLHLSKTKCVIKDEEDYDLENFKNFSNQFETENKDSKKSLVGININRNDLYYLNHILYLQLEDCDISYLNPDSFEFLIKNLSQLNLSYNKLIKLSNLKIFLKQFMDPKLNKSKNNGLESLDLSGIIKSLKVPKDFFYILSKTKIKHLYLKYILWKDISAGDLPSLPNLQTLYIENSFIENLDENAFSNCENLINLSLKGNFLNKVPINILEPLIKLEYLDLSGFKSNEIKNKNFYTTFSIQKKTFVYGTNLKELNINYKNIEKLERKMFIGLFKLENLQLKGINLKSIEYLTFFSLKSIVKLNLSFNTKLINNIRNSDEDEFVGLEAIEELNLSNCNLTNEDLNDFNLFRRIKENLRKLDLSNNQITQIKQNTFQNFTELRYLNLSNNKIKSWHNYKILNYNNLIKSLDVSSNEFDQITPEMLADFRKLKQLSFSKNPLICDCNWNSSILWLNNDKKQKKILNKLNNHDIQEHLENLVNRQQEIVTNVYSIANELPPKSILDWIEYSNIEFLNEQHPLRSNNYYCHLKNNSIIALNKFIYHYCLNKNLYTNNSAKFTILVIIATSLMLLTTFCLMIALIYNSTLRNLITIVEEDFIRRYEYDAFVSYNVNDSDWVFNYLVPSLEEIPETINSDQNKNNLDTNTFNLLTWVSKEEKNNFYKNNIKGKKKKLKSLNKTEKKLKTFQNKVKLCVYDRDFVAGKQISECITESIRNSRKVILVVSKNFAQSPWCRFETDLAHHTLIDQNRDGLILIKLEENISSDFLEKVSPQLHFLLKTRIYLQWSKNAKEQIIFWKKLHSALGINKTYTKTYSKVRQYYQNYCTNFKTELKRRHSITPIQYNSNSFVEKPNKKIQLNDSFKKDINKSLTADWIKMTKYNLPKNENSPIVPNNLNILLNTSDNLNTDKQIQNINRNLITSFLINNRSLLELILATHNLFPHLLEKILNFKRLLINLVFSGFSPRT